MIQNLYMLALLIVMILAVIGVFHNSFNDNLVQRVGMAAMFFGALEAAIHPARVSLGYLFAFGVALYGLGTAYKCWKYHGYKRPPVTE